MRTKDYIGKYRRNLIRDAAEPLVHRLVWDTPETVPPGYHCGPSFLDFPLLKNERMLSQLQSIPKQRAHTKKNNTFFIDSPILVLIYFDYNIQF